MLELEALVLLGDKIDKPGRVNKWVLRWRMKEPIDGDSDTKWDEIPNCWSCKTEGVMTNGRDGERNM